MKKIFLYSLIACLSMNAFGQRAVTSAQAKSPSSEISGDVNLESHTFYKTPSSKTTTLTGSAAGEIAKSRSCSGSDITWIPIGSAGNILTVIDGGMNQVSWDKDINSVTFTHRQKAGTGVNGGSGGVDVDYSTDGGNTWTSNIAVTPDYDSHLYTGVLGGNRFPNGCIYNPPANTNASNAYNIFAGVAHDTTSATHAWGYQYRGSSHFDGSAVDENYVQNDGTSDDYLSKNLQKASTGVLYTINSTINNTNVVANNTLNFSQYRVFGGLWNTGTSSVDWTYQTLTPNWHLYTNSTDGSPNYYAGFDWSVAFGPDGMTGYAVMIGGLESDPVYYPHPVVYKTVDGGFSWGQLPSFDFGSLPDIQTYIFPTSAGDYLPWTTNMDMVVGNDNKLQLFSETISKYTSDNSDDSLYSLTVLNDGAGGTVYYTVMLQYTVSDGTDWDAHMIDTIIQNYGVVPDAVAANSQDVSFRPQVSRTLDGSKIFFTWSKSDPTILTSNDAPDVWGEGYEISSGLYTQPKNFTKNAPATHLGNNYYPTASPNVIVSGDTYDYEIPIVSAIPGPEDTDPADFYYMKGAGFNQADFGAGASAAAGFTYAIGAGGVVNFSNTSENADTYDWDFGDGTANSPLGNPLHTYASSGTYTVVLTASNATSSDQTCKDITVIVESVVDHSLDNAVFVYPSLTSGNLNIVVNGNNFSALQVEIYNMIGEKVMTASMDKSATFDLSNLSQGNYVVKIEGENGIATRQISIVK